MTALAAIMLTLAGVLTGCGSGDASTSADPLPAPPPAAEPSQDPAGQVGPAETAAIRAATEFLAALVAEDHDAAYGLLSPAAQAGVTLEDFAAARQAKNASARSLGQRYELTEATGDQTRMTVTGEGRLADGTPAAITLPLVASEAGWRVDAVPTAF